MANKKSNKVVKFFKGILITGGCLLFAGLIAMGITYCVKPYTIDVQWQQTDTTTELPADDEQTNNENTEE